MMSSTISFALLVLFIYNTNADIASEVKVLKAEVDELEKFKASQTTYCRLHARGHCGPCICKDDFNVPKKYYCDCQNQPAKRDCLQFYLDGYRVDGIYQVTMNGFKTTQVFCDQTRRGGGWTVIQRRMDGSVNFYRAWDEYKNGFGQLQREFWLGNDNIHLLTAQGIYPKGSEARIEFTSSVSQSLIYRFHYSHKFSHFQVDSERSNYLLHVSGYSGNHGQSYLAKYNNKMEFSTYDRDNSGSTKHNCAKSFNYGGWWYNGKTDDCTSSQTAGTNFNGPYDSKGSDLWYRTFNAYGKHLVLSEIKVRRLR